MKHLDLFSGIGGFALAAEMAWEGEDVEHTFCDNEPFAQAVLRKHWPNAPIFSDIKQFNTAIRDAMILVCEEKTDSALCVEYQRRLSGVPTASHATANESLNGGNKTENDTVPTSEGGLGQARTKLSPTMGESVSVAEKPKESFFPSTTGSITETQSDGSTNPKHGNSYSSEDFQRTINCSATTATTLKLITEHVLTKPIDLLTGGFPCQPFSAAGRRKGTEDDRHLWPSMLEAIRLLRPTYVLGENVGGFLTWDGGMVFEQVCTDLEAEGYEVCPLVIPACAVNAPHRRDRVWIAAHAIGSDAIGTPGQLHGSEGEERIQEWDEVGELGEPGGARVPSDPEYARFDGTQDREGGATGSDGDPSGTHQDEQPARPALSRDDDADTVSSRRNGRSAQVEFRGEKGQRKGCVIRSEDGRFDWSHDWPTVAARLCTLDDGLPDGLARPRGWRNAALKGAGNAIVPQVAAEILRAMRNRT